LYQLAVQRRMRVRRLLSSYYFQVVDTISSVAMFPKITTVTDECMEGISMADLTAEVNSNVFLQKHPLTYDGKGLLCIAYTWL